MLRRRLLLLGGAMLLTGHAALATEAAACAAWQPLPHRALRSLPDCGQAPIERLAGRLCMRHEWLCGQSSFRDWLDQWMAEMDAPIQMERRLGQLIWSGEQDNTAWAVFWPIADEQAKGFVILVSRLRAMPTKEGH